MINVRFVNETSGMKMIIDSRVPYSIISIKVMNKYMEEKRFRFSENVYESKTKVIFPVIIK